MSVRLCAVETCRKDDTPRVIYDGAHVCQPCTDRTRANIAALPAALRDLGAVLAAAGVLRQRVTGTPSHPLPIRLEVTEARHDIRTWLVDEVHMWRAELALTGWPTTSDAQGHVTWLCRHVAATRHREWAPTTHDAARALRGRAAALCDLPRDKATFPVLACPDVTCCHDTALRGIQPGHVWARVPADPDEAMTLLCNVCGRTWPWSEWTSLARLAKAADLRRREPAR